MITLSASENDSANSQNNRQKMEVLLMFDKKQPEKQPEVIHSYTRADALRDGVLVDAGAIASEVGFKYSVALSRAAWEKCVAVPSGIIGQDEVGRLYDVLHMLAASIRRGEDTATVSFAVHVRNSNRRGCRPSFRSTLCAGRGTRASPSSPSCCLVKTRVG